MSFDADYILNVCTGRVMCKDLSFLLASTPYHACCISPPIHRYANQIGIIISFMPSRLASDLLSLAVSMEQHI